MYRFKKLMVALNLDEHDTTLIQYAGFISKMAQSKEVYFVHVSDTFNIPEEIKKVYPEIISPVDEAAKKRMKENVEKHFNGFNGAALKYNVIEGPLLGTLVSFSKEYDIDLAIMGYDLKTAETLGHLPEKMARKAFCSVLIIPDNTSRVRLDKILVTVDFSEHSLNSLDIGSAFAKAAGLSSIDIVNTYRVPEGFYKTGKTFEEFSEVMLKNAKKKTRELLAKADLKGVGINPYLILNDDVVEGVHQVSDQTDTDLIVVGARGRTGDIAAILLGSVTEALLRKIHRPLLAVKTKGEGLDILGAISEL